MSLYRSVYRARTILAFEWRAARGLSIFAGPSFLKGKQLRNRAAIPRTRSHGAKQMTDKKLKERDE